MQIICQSFLSPKQLSSNYVFSVFIEFFLVSFFLTILPRIVARQGKSPGQKVSVSEKYCLSRRIPALIEPCLRCWKTRDMFSEGRTQFSELNDALLWGKHSINLSNDSSEQRVSPTFAYHPALPELGKAEKNSTKIYFEN